MNNYFTSFRLGLLCHLGVSNIRATGVLNKNGLRKSTIIGHKQLQKKTKELDHLEQNISSKKSSATLTVVGCSCNRAVYIASSKSSEPKRFARRLNKVERKYIQD